MKIHHTTTKKNSQNQQQINMATTTTVLLATSCCCVVSSISSGQRYDYDEYDNFEMIVIEDGSPSTAHNPSAKNATDD